MSSGQPTQDAFEMDCGRWCSEDLRIHLCLKAEKGELSKLNLRGNSLRRRLPGMSLMFLLPLVLLPIQIGVVQAEAFADPIGDLFDRDGKPVTAEPYLDIVEVELTRSGTEYNARIKVNGPLPSSLGDPSIFLEWDLLVDIDQNRETHPWSWGLLDNGIGVDMLIRLRLGPSGNAYRADVYNEATTKSVSIGFKVDGATVQLKFDDTSLRVVSKAFDLVFATRKYGNYSFRAGAALALDKAPNQGSFTFTDGRMSLTSPFKVEHRYEGPIIDAHAVPDITTSRWMVDTLESYHRAGVDKVIFRDEDGVLEAHRLRPTEIIPSLRVPYMNRTEAIKAVEAALKRGFLWVGEVSLRHRSATWYQGKNIPADDPVALQIYDLCARYQVPITIHHDNDVYKEAYEELERAVERSPNCIILFHGWGFPQSFTQFLEGLVIRHPNLYIEIAGLLERDLGPGKQGFNGYTYRDLFAYPDGMIKEEWRIFFEKYPERIVNGFDFYAESVYTFENIKIRVDYFRNLFGQINEKAAERINYKNVEDLLAKRICLMNVSLSSESVKVGDMLTVTARLWSMAASPISNETVTFSLEGSDGRTTALGESKTDRAGFAVLNCTVNVGGGSYSVVASHPESGSCAYRSSRSKLTVNQPITTASVSTASTTTTEPQKKCIIATAAFGSELAPEVQALRTFRDSTVMSTQSGRAFMTVFNNWYYSFSPQVANALSENHLLRDVVKTSLYPLIGVLSIPASIQSVLPFNPELATVMAGLVASTLIGLVYLFPAMLLISTLLPSCLRSRRNR